METIYTVLALSPRHQLRVEVSVTAGLARWEWAVYSYGRKVAAGEGMHQVDPDFPAELLFGQAKLEALRWLRSDIGRAA